jgi:hypothetical protein
MDQGRVSVVNAMPCSEPGLRPQGHCEAANVKMCLTEKREGANPGMSTQVRGAQWLL